MDTERRRPLWADLTNSSTREEVLAAVAEAEALRARLTYDDPGAVVCCGEPGDDDPDAWDRTEAGDVTNGLAFNAHMDRVGEEDQSLPGWDFGP